MYQKDIFILLSSILKMVRIVLFLLFLCLALGKPSKFSMDDLERRTFNFFWETAHPDSGLIPDRFPSISFSSIAAHGFGLTSYLIGVERNFITREQAAKRVLLSLKFLWNLPQNPEIVNTAGYKGFFYHFLHMETGLRFRDVELSTIDTALLLAGVMTCYSFFDNQNDPIEKEIREVSYNIYARVEWDWFLVGNTNLLSMGWHPETQKFLPDLWAGYNEAMIIYILALGSPTHPLTGASWEAWTKTYLWANYMGQEHVNFGPLFGHQYSQMYVDFREIQDAYMKSKGIDYFINSKRATLANREYCIKNPNGFKNYEEDIWGLTANDGPGDEERIVNGRKVKFMSYSARGAAIDYKVDDGTIAPTAAGGSIPFAPKECINVLEKMYDTYGDLLYGEYGFKDAFNPSYTFSSGEKGWFDNDYIGIDQGPIIIQIANNRNSFVWNLLRKNKFIVKGLEKAGFKGGWLNKSN